MTLKNIWKNWFGAKANQLEEKVRRQDILLELEEQLKEVKEMDRQLYLFSVLTSEGTSKRWKESEAELRKERAAMLRSMKELKKALDKTEVW